MEPQKAAPPGETTLWERTAEAEWWLREYGKSPAEVRKMPAWFVARVPMVVAVRREEEERRNKS